MGRPWKLTPEHVLWYTGGTISMPVSKKFLKVLRSFSKYRDGNLLAKGRYICDCMFGKPLFPNPTVNLDALRAKLDRFETLSSKAQFRDVRYVTAKKKVRDQIVADLNLLAAYVESVCPNDEAGIKSSGFDLAPTSYAGPKPLNPPKIKKINQGKSGELLIDYTNAGPQTSKYEVRRGIDGTDPDSWPITHCAGTGESVSFTGLTPGTVYAFQVRAFSKLGHTDWSDSATRMCI